jgi:hypothetical protein
MEPAARIGRSRSMSSPQRKVQLTELSFRVAASVSPCRPVRLVLVPLGLPLSEWIRPRRVLHLPAVAGRRGNVRAVSTPSKCNSACGPWVRAKTGNMPDVQTENRFSQALLHLLPEEISVVQEALVDLSADPFRGRMLAGADNSYLRRASDQLRIIYRIERRPQGELRSNWNLLSRRRSEVRRRAELPDLG